MYKLGREYESDCSIHVCRLGPHTSIQKHTVTQAAPKSSLGGTRKPKGACSLGGGGVVFGPVWGFVSHRAKLIGDQSSLTETR